MSLQEREAAPTPEPKPAADRLLDHEYDGIREYDNPMPRWWLWIFYATIAYSVLYCLNVPFIGSGAGRVARYEREVAQARERRARSAPAEATVGEPAILAALGDPARLAAGKTTFTMQCAPCHRADGGGSIGPNLTDSYWIHGARPMEVHRTVSGGVLDKGMPAWNTMLEPDEVLQVVAYVLSLHDTHPANPKPAQGVLVEQDRAEGGGER